MNTLERPWMVKLSMYPRETEGGVIEGTIDLLTGGSWVPELCRLSKERKCYRRDQLVLGLIS